MNNIKNIEKIFNLVFVFQELKLGLKYKYNRNKNNLKNICQFIVPIR